MVFRVGQDRKLKSDVFYRDIFATDSNYGLVQVILLF